MEGRYLQKMQNLNTYILAIESSCDDTSCAVLANKKVLSNITANQQIHAQYGGVVPELASRDHQKNSRRGGRCNENARGPAGPRQECDVYRATRTPLNRIFREHYWLGDRKERGASQS